MKSLKCFFNVVNILNWIKNLVVKNVFIKFEYFLSNVRMRFKKIKRMYKNNSETKLIYFLSCFLFWKTDIFYSLFKNEHDMNFKERCSMDNFYFLWVKINTLTFDKNFFSRKCKMKIQCNISCILKNFHIFILNFSKYSTIKYL